MGGKRISSQELQIIESLRKEGLTDREIGSRLNRSEVAIKNIRFKKRILTKAIDQNEALAKQRDELIQEIQFLQTVDASYTEEINNLEKRKRNLEASIRTDQGILEQKLSSALVDLKNQKPELFQFNVSDQVDRIVKFFMSDPSRIEL